MLEYREPCTALCALGHAAKNHVAQFAKQHIEKAQAAVGKEQNQGQAQGHHRRSVAGIEGIDQALEYQGQGHGRQLGDHQQGDGGGHMQGKGADAGGNGGQRLLQARRPGGKIGAISIGAHTHRPSLGVLVPAFKGARGR